MHLLNQVMGVGAKVMVIIIIAQLDIPSVCTGAIFNQLDLACLICKHVSIVAA